MADQINCIDQAYNRQTKKHDIDKIKACLERKIDRYFASCDQFHANIRDAMIDARDGLVDLKFVEIDAKIKELAKKQAFSLDVFLSDMILSLFFGPLAGTAAAKLFMKGLSGISGVRGGIRQFSNTKEFAEIGKAGKLTAGAKESLAEKGIRTISSQNGAASSSQAGKYSEFASGVIVDSFELIFDKILHITDEKSASVRTPKQKFDSSDGYDYARTPLELNTTRARKYYNYQKRLNDISKLNIEFMLNNLTSVASLSLLNGLIDGLNASIEGFENSDVDFYEEVKNLTKIFLLPFYFGPPSDWATHSRVVGGEMDWWEGARAFATGSTPPVERELLIKNVGIGREYEYRINIPEDLKSMLIENICMPGTKQQYKKRYLEYKQARLNRKTGDGIDKKKQVWLPFETVRPNNGVNINDPKSEYYTADETAFKALQNKASEIYVQCLANDSYFLSLLQKEGYFRPGRK